MSYPLMDSLVPLPPLHVVFVMDKLSSTKVKQKQKNTEVPNPVPLSNTVPACVTLVYRTKSGTFRKDNAVTGHVLAVRVTIRGLGPTHNLH